MRGRIVEVRERKDSKLLLVEVEDETGLYDALKYHNGAVDLEPVWRDPEEEP